VQGIKSLGFLPPVIITVDQWNDYVLGQGETLQVDPKPETRNPKPETRRCGCTLNPKPETRNPKPETRNPTLQVDSELELLGRGGFMILMKQAVKRYQLRTLNKAVENQPDSWCKDSITAVLLGVKGLLVEDLELAMGGLYAEAEKAREEDVDYVKPGDEADRAAMEMLLKRLVTDMHKMHKRFDTVEADLASMNDFKARVFRPAAPMVPSGPGEVDEALPVSAAQSARAAGQPETSARTGGTKAAFIGRQASVQRAATGAGAGKQSHGGGRDKKGADGGAAGGGSGRAEASETRGMASGWGLGALTDGSTMPLSPPDPSKMLSQGNEVANNLFGGVMGGLSSLGSSVTNAMPMPKMPDLPEGMQMKMPEMSSMSLGGLQMPMIPGMGAAAGGGGAQAEGPAKK
jgi:hypothetical protein